MKSGRGDEFDADYYERGVQTGKSLYENYRWLGEPTIRMARKMVDVLDLSGDHRVLDYGCAKGYLVRALRILGVPAWGVDISGYAIGCADLEVRPYCALISENGSHSIPRAHPNARLNGLGSGFLEESAAGAPDYDVVISKDVLEHVPQGQLPGVLAALARTSRRLFAIVPLGDGERFVIPEYEDDPTHEIRQPLDWWCAALEAAGWAVERREYLIPGIKDAWSHYPTGNGFFVCRRRDQAGS